MEAKTVVPSVTDRLVRRQRLDQTLAALLEEHRIVGVWATAGAGKTTAVRQGVLALDWPLAWLTLDASDAAPGRFLEYLRAAAARVSTQAPTGGLVLGSQITHFEAAALLAETLPAERLVIVLDELERIADSPTALEVLSGFLRYLHPEHRVVLIGRREVASEAINRLGFGAVGRLGEDQLAFSPDEAATALELRGIEHVDPGRVVEATGGWVTGVLFEAWKSREHVGGSGGEADPLAGYLGAEILDGLDADEREFLIRTSLFDEVTDARAEALNELDARRLMRRLQARHLPIIWRREGEVMRCHPRFREYLRSLLDGRDPALSRELHYAFGLMLEHEGHHEGALEALLALGRTADALGPASHALPAAIARLDLDLAQSWLDQFAAVGFNHEAFLMRAQLAISVARENFREAVEMADALRSMGALDPAEPENCVFAAWVYWHVGRLDDARAILAEMPAGDGRDVIRHVLSLTGEDAPESIPQLSDGPLDAFTLRISFARGRLDDVLNAPVSRWTPASSERASALRARGDLEATRTMLSEAPGALANLRFEGTVAVELMIDLRQEQAAREALVRARKRIHQSGSLVLETVGRILAAKLELRLRRDPETALAILRGIETGTPFRAYRYLQDAIDTWAGYALLLQEHNDEALARLRRATASMVRADRVLELSTAAVYLAEAEALNGSDELAEQAAKLALATASRQGSRYALLQGLDDFPSVLARQIESEVDHDGPWREIGRSMATRGQVRVLSPAPIAHLRDLGIPALVCAGEERRARITKSYALLAYLLEHEGRASRTELLAALFDFRQDDSTRAYLRQAAQTLRAILPEEIVLLREADSFLLDGASKIETDTMRLRARLSSALTLIGDSRLRAAQTVLDEHRSAVYLQGVNCPWVEARREEIDTMLMTARIDTAVVAIQSHRYAIAQGLLADVVSVDPLREQAWRLLMRVSAAQGFDDLVIDTYRRCEGALASVGLAPSASTRLLVEGLRR
ncbi:MAG TPA: BTAD domain-containing putative transcriptional regulator [Solirubrobacteraceae bacterium]|nr:BTAD domain-containing putative transcriptional regulator [Solirubrobacteraceae bacterium]